MQSDELAPNENEVDIHEISAVSLAFLGDAVFETLVRVRLVKTTRYTPSKLHASAIKLVSATGQHKALKFIMPLLTQQESAVARRGKNTAKTTAAKNAAPKYYSAATGLEALFGFLYLKNEKQRITELFNIIWENIYLKSDEE